MGGSGGGYSDYSTGASSPSMDCASLNFETTLLSSNPEILLTLHLRQRLQIRQNQYSAVAQTDAGEPVGSIVTNVSQLLACMDKGNLYVAEILNIEDGACRVKVTLAEP